ncbi:MAG: YebC/PmpR family DNA-binding transcriptional regulator [Oscillospiraceae bacterium]
MSGHSKWSTIKRKKGITDSKRAGIFTKIGREISVAVKEGGADPNSNSKLKDVIAKAKINNVPNDNIDRIIKKAQGEGDKNNYEEITYEGYGPCGVAVMVETLTDNRNRTAGEMRHYFDKCGGNLGQNGSVSFMFAPKGLIVIENNGYSEDKIIDDALVDGVLDVSYSEDVIEIYTEPNSLRAVRDIFTEKGYTFEVAEVSYIPATYVSLDEEATEKMQKLLDLLEDNDDVQEVYHNWEMPEEPDED